MSPSSEKGLSRGRLASAAVDLIEEDGLDGLSMRTLADRVGVRAASIYWHVRDRRELLELVADALLDEASPPPRSASWRAGALAVLRRLEAVVSRRPKAARVLIEAPGPLARSAAQARLAALLAEGGLPAAEAEDVARMLLTHVVAGGAGGEPAPRVAAARPAVLAIDSGSRGVEVRAGPDVQGLAEVARDASSASPAVVRGDRVVVRRLRGVGRGAVRLNPGHPWTVRVQGPTWNTLLDLRGLDVRDVHIDGGAARVEILLPPPRGEVTVKISGGAPGIRLRRPPGVAAVADISSGAVQVRLDDFAIGASTGDLHWESRAMPALDRYRLLIPSGSLRVTLEEDATLEAEPAAGAASPARGGRSAVEVVLDAIEAANSKKDSRPGVA